MYFFWYITNDVANAFFSIPPAKDERPQLLSLGIAHNTSGTGCCKWWKLSPTIYQGIVHKTSKQHNSRELLHCIGDVPIRGKTVEAVLSNGQQVILSSQLEPISRWPANKQYEED